MYYGQILENDVLECVEFQVSVGLIEGFYTEQKTHSHLASKYLDREGAYDRFQAFSKVTAHD